MIKPVPIFLEAARGDSFRESRPPFTPLQKLLIKKKVPGKKIFSLEFIETNDSFGPFGAKGVGEPGLVPTAPAIANAIYNAVGIRIHDLPITPGKILEALKRKK